MIWLPKPDQTEFVSRRGKPVQVGFDGCRLTSYAGILLPAEIEQRLKIAERLAACIEDRRDPERVLHGRAHYPNCGQHRVPRPGGTLVQADSLQIRRGPDRD
jgi:hypothetical protein